MRVFSGQCRLPLDLGFGLAAEPIHQGVRRPFAAFTKDIACDLAVRHDQGLQYTSDFEKEIAFLGIKSSPAFVRALSATAAPNGLSAR